MNTAFEITPDDVETALAGIGRRISEEKAAELFDEFILFEAGRVEEAALAADDIDDQTAYAYAEIVAILRENDAI